MTDLADDRARRPGDSDLHRRQRTKNRLVAGLLVGFVVLLFLLSIVRMGAGQ